MCIQVHPHESSKAVLRAAFHLPLDLPQLFLVFGSFLMVPRKSSEVRGHTPVRAIQRFHSLRIQILDRLLVAPTDTVRRAAVAVEGVNGLGDAHLRGGHCSQRVEVSFGFFLQAERGGFQRAVATLFDFVLSVARLLHLASLHHDLCRRTADLRGGVSMQPQCQILTSRQHTFFLNPDHDMLAMSGFGRCEVFLNAIRGRRVKDTINSVIG